MSQGLGIYNTLLLPCGRSRLWGAIVVERKYFTCPSRESNPGRWIYRQTLYHVAVKAGFYSNVVECLAVDPASWVRFPAGTGKIFSLYDTCAKKSRNFFPGKK